MKTPTLSRPREWAVRVIRKLPAGRTVLLHQLMPPPPNSTFFAKLPASRTGLEFSCDPTCPMTWHLFSTGEYEPREAALYARLLAPGQTFVDVGTFWGYYTLLATESVGPSGRVVSIEAEPRNFARLEQNIARNHLAQVTAIHAAAGLTAGTVAMVGINDNQANRGSSHIHPTAASQGVPGERSNPLGSTTYEVRCNTVDALLDEAGVGRVDLLKMDIEGAEALALPGMRAGLQAHRYRQIAIELHANVLAEYGSDIETTLAPLREAGYRLLAIEPDSVRPIDAAVLSPKISHILALAPGEPEPPADL